MRTTTADGAGARTGGLRTWRRSRPFAAGLLLLLAGTELIATSWAGFGLVRFGGTGGLGCWVTGGLLIWCGITLWRTPRRRIGAGVLAAALALGSLVVADLGGLVLGFLLAALGSALALAWMPA
ncbi:DUF6114 domain-containing protein [Streptomyces sp. NPDC002446]